MYTLKEVQARFPECYSVGADLMARIDGQNVVLADLGNSSFNLTKKGQELMVAPSEAVSEPVKRGRKPKEKVDAAPDIADPDDLFA